MTRDTEQVVSHRVEAGMNNLVIHRKYKYRVEVSLERLLERVAGFAIDVTGLALR
jgi:hypothetical protein